eukprot:221508-Amphidinium_carterae.1
MDSLVEHAGEKASCDNVGKRCLSFTLFLLGLGYLWGWARYGDGVYRFLILQSFFPKQACACKLSGKPEYAELATPRFVAPAFPSQRLAEIQCSKGISIKPTNQHNKSHYILYDTELITYCTQRFCLINMA